MPGCPCRHLHDALAPVKPISAYPPHCCKHKKVRTAGNLHKKVFCNVDKLVTHCIRKLTAAFWIGLLWITWHFHLLEIQLKVKKNMQFKSASNLSKMYFLVSTYRHWAVSYSPLDNGGISLAYDRSWLINRLHSDLLAVYQQPHLSACHTQSQLMPLTIKQLFHAMKGPQHVAPMGTGVEKV